MFYLNHVVSIRQNIGSHVKERVPHFLYKSQDLLTAAVATTTAAGAGAGDPDVVVTNVSLGRTWRSPH